MITHHLVNWGPSVSSFKNNKNRLYVSAATGVVSLCLTAIGYSESGAQSSPQALPPVSVAPPPERARPARAVRTRSTTAPRAARVAPRPTSERPPQNLAATTMGTTHTIGTPAPPYAGGQFAQGGTLHVDTELFAIELRSFDRGRIPGA